MPKRVIVIVTGGTAGHVFPGQALSEILETKNNILFLTDSRGSRYFTDKSKIKQLNISNISGGVVKKICSFIKLGIATLKCLYLLKTYKVKLVIGFGGLTSFPGLFASKILRIPIIIHEQNAVLGKANRFFLQDAHLVATSYENTISSEQATKNISTGNPIRSVVFNAKRRRTRITQEIYILVIGGSQGAKIMDEVVAKAITSIPTDLQEQISIWHQVRDINNVKAIYQKSKIKKFYIEYFFKDAPQLMADSDLVITRAGASALSEIEHLKVPSIVIPMESSSDNHQYHNAIEHSKKGSSIIIEEKDLSVELLLSKLTDLLVYGQLEKLYNRAKEATDNTSAQKLAVKVNEVIINLRL